MLAKSAPVQVSCLSSLAHRFRCLVVEESSIAVNSKGAIVVWHANLGRDCIGGRVGLRWADQDNPCQQLRFSFCLDRGSY